MLGFTLDRIVPLRVNVVMPNSYRLHLFVGNLLSRFVFMGVQFRLHFQTGLGSGGTDEVDDRFITYQRFTSPSDTDLGKQPMLYFIPLAGSGREVTDCHRQAVAISKLLDTVLPQSIPLPLLPPPSAVIRSLVAFG